MVRLRKDIAILTETTDTTDTMMRLTKTCGATLGLCALSLLAAAPASAQQFGGTTPETAIGDVIERILVKVNGDIITQTDLEARQIGLMRQRGLQPSTEAELLQALQQVTPEVLSMAVDELLMVQQGRELGYHLTDEQFGELVAGIKEENNFATDAEFEQALEQSEGMTVDDLRRAMERQMLVNQVQQIEILQKITLTEVESREYYEAHLDEFTEPATVTMREILVTVPEGAGGGVNVFADEVAKQEVEAARQRVLDGADFGIVAVAVSDAASKANGGLIGPLELAFVSETVQDVLDGLEVGDLSEPMRIPTGYHLIKLEARTAPTPRSFEEVHDAIADNVFSDRRLAEYGRYLNRLRDEAVIEWKDEQLKQAYEQYETARASQLGASNE